MYVESVLQRLEKYGNLGVNIAKYDHDEDYYDLGDGFCEPDGDVEPGTQEMFEEAEREGYYIARVKEVRIEPELQPPSPRAEVRMEPQEPPKAPSHISGKVSRILAQIAIVYHRPPKVPLPADAMKHLDQLAFQLQSEPVPSTQYCDIDEVLAKTLEISHPAAVTYVSAVFQCMLRAAAQISQQNFDFAPLKTLLDSFGNPQLNELGAGLARLQNVLQETMMRAAVDDLVKRKAAATTALLKEVRRLAGEGRPVFTDDVRQLLATAEALLKALVQANNEYVRKYPNRTGKRYIDEQRERQDFLAVVKTASQIPAEAKKREDNSAPEWGLGFDDPPL